MKSFIFITLILLFLASCNTSMPKEPIVEEIEKEDSMLIPENAIPIEYDGHIVIWGSYNDSTKAKWIFDTGSPAAVLDSSFYTENGYSMQESIPSVSFGAGNGITNTFIIQKDHTIQIDTFKHLPQNTFLLDLRKAVGDKTADGILPLDYFGNRTVEISYQDKYLRVLSEYYWFDTSWTSIPFELKDRRILIEGHVKVEEGKSINGPFILDLGSPGSFTLNRKASKEIKVAQSNKKIEIIDLLNGGIGGGTSVGVLEADICQVGNFSLRNESIEYVQNTIGAFSETTNYGIIGNRFFEGYNIAIDFPNKKLWLKPHPDYTRKKGGFKKTGLYIKDRTITEGGFIVNGMSRNSPADSSTIQLGDLIVEINGKKVSEEDKHRAVNHLIDSLWFNGGVRLKVLRNDSVMNFLVPSADVKSSYK